MAEVNKITVDSKRWGTLRVAFHHTVIWTYLVGAEGVSHMWFGGSWVIDLMIITAFICVLISIASRASGTAVSMTPAEIRLWVTAGMPLDIKKWQASRKLSSVA